MRLPDTVERIKEGYLIRRRVETAIGASEDAGLEYSYDEAYLTDAEYAAYLAEKNKADIDYLAMELEIDL